MSEVHFSELQHNLSEIYAAMHAKPKNGQLQLAAAFSSCVYFQGYLTGRIVKFLNKIWSRIYPPRESLVVEKITNLAVTTFFDHAVHFAYDVRQRRIWNQMREIDESWKNSLHPPNFAKQCRRYEDYLLKELRGSVEADNPIYLDDFIEKGKIAANPQEVKEWRHAIINFHQATHLFWSLFVKNNKDNIELKKPIKDFLQPHSTLADRPLYKALKKEGRWVQMEGVMQQSIPVALFAKLSDPKSLTVNENKRLKTWIQTLNQCQKSISPKLFVCVLKEVMNVIHLQGSSSLTLAELLLWLDREGCQIIHQEDPAHMDWREKLRAGDVIECNGKQLILGKQLSPDKLIDDDFKIFELKNYPNYVVKIANNRLRLLLENQKAKNEEEHWGVRLVETIANLEQDKNKSEIHGLDDQGCCVVQEKLSSSFAGHSWLSHKMELNQEEEDKALIFANHLFCMHQWKATPQNLSFAHLMWDKNGNLKSTRLLKKGGANYNEWEAYCEKAANGNIYVLNYLMHVSKLHEHKVGVYYREAIEHTLKTGKTDLIGRPLPLGHRQENYNQHIKKLCAEAQEIRESCLKIVIAHLRKKKQYSYQQESKLQKLVADKLLQIYRASPMPGRFLPDFKERVIAGFTGHDIELPILPTPKDFQDYYQEKHLLMMKYNQACLSDSNIK